MEIWFPLARAVHFAACLLLLGWCVFDRFVADLRSVARPLIALALPVVLISGIVWFAGVAVSMSGDSLDRDALRAVWNETSFGRVWEFRGVCWIAVCLTMWWGFFWRTTAAPGKWLALIFNLLLTASLAWAGHGRAHLVFDVSHLLAASVWPAGLLPFALVLADLRHRPDTAVDILGMARRFSAMSLFAVAVLLISGVGNSWYLLDSPKDLFWTSYGRVLMVKIAAFALMTGLGAMNLLRLKPPLAAPGPAKRLQMNVMIELILGLAVLVIVGFLGLMEPAAI